MDDRKVEPPALPSAETTTQEAGELALLVGDGVGPYRIVSLLGEGGMGRVYLADDTRLERRVAIKVMASSRVPGASLLREARMGARLHHANIAAVYDVLEAGGRLHIVMEHLEGRSLAHLLAEAPLAPERAASIAAGILAAVGHAHAAGVIHCDLKPANVFVLPDDAVKVLDFGLARLDEPSTHTHSSMGLAGTPRYMAPERLLGAHPGPQTDVYSVGVILSEMLRRPQPSRAAPAETLRPRTDAATLHATLLTVADAATAADPARRYRSAEEMAAALERACQGKGAGGSRPFITRKGALASGFLTVTAALLVSLLLGPGMPTPRPVVGVSLSAIGADPISAHMAAALQQLLEHTLSGAKDLTMIRRLPGQTDEGDVGATHTLSGTVERSGPDLRIVLSVADADGEVLASHQMTSPIDALSTLGTLFAEAASTVMERARLPLEHATAGDPTARQALSIDTQAFEEYAQARMYMRSPDMTGSLDYAIGLLQRAVERDSSFVLAHAGLAEAYWQKYLATRDNAWTDKARASALDAIRLNPDDPIVRYTLAVIYRGSGRAEDALSEVTRAIELQPANDDHYRLRGRLHTEAGRLDSALADLKTALSLRPGYWENHRAVGLTLFDAGRYPESIPHFRRVTELRPSSAAAFQMLGVAHHAANQIPEALQAYEKALSIAPGANTYGNIAKIHYDSGRFEQARRAYEESIRLQPKEPVTHRNLGDTLQRLGLHARARTAYETAIALGDETLKVNPSSLGVISLQALCYAKLGNATEARRLADTVTSAPHPQAFARYRAGVALVLIGDPRGIDEVVTAIAEGHSRSEAALDVDLASVRGDSRLAAALDEHPQ